MLVDIHISELIPKQEYELRIDRFVYRLKLNQLLDLYNSIKQLIEHNGIDQPS